MFFFLLVPSMQEPLKWNLPRDLLAAQDGSSPREPILFCPETFTMAEDPKVIAVGEKYSRIMFFFVFWGGGGDFSQKNRWTSSKS